MPQQFSLSMWQDHVDSQQFFYLAKHLRERNRREVADANIDLAYFLDRGWRDKRDRSFVAFWTGRRFQTNREWKAAGQAYQIALEGFLAALDPITREYAAYTYRRLGEIAEEGGDLGIAINNYAQSILVSPRHSDLSRFVNLVLTNHTQDETSWTLINLCRNADYDATYLWSNSAVVFIDRGAPQLAERVLAEAPPELAATPPIRVAQARLAVAQGKWAQAELLYTDLLAELMHGESKDNPQIASLANALGETIFQQSRYTEAIFWFDRAIQFDPTVARYWYNLGLAHQRMGHLVEARAAFEQAIVLKPDYAAAQQALQNLGR